MYGSKMWGMYPLRSQLFLIGIKVYRMILPKLELIYLVLRQKKLR